MDSVQDCIKVHYAVCVIQVITILNVNSALILLIAVAVKIAQIVLRVKIVAIVICVTIFNQKVIALRINS